MILKILISIVEGEGDRTPVGDDHLPLHRMQRVVYGQDLKIVGGEMLQLFLEGMQGKPQLMKIRCLADILILDDGEFLQSHGADRITQGGGAQDHCRAANRRVDAYS